MTFRRQLNRVAPALPVSSYKTYSIKSPLASHWRDASCAEYGCTAYANGWQTKVDEATELGQKQAHYIRKQSGRGFTEQREGVITVFSFEPGQTCFAPGHRVPSGREHIYTVRGGDWRGATGDIRKVALWLGHASIQSTEHYLRADPAEKLAVLAAHGPPAIRAGRFRPPPDRLMAVLAAARDPNAPKR